MADIRLEEIRPRLRQDAAFIRTPEGFVATLADESFMVKGRTAYDLLTALFPHLTGEQTLAAMCEGLDQAHQTSVVSLITTLMKRGLVIDHQPPSPGVDTAALEKFAEQASFLEHLGDRGARGFQKFRDARVVVVGDRDLGEEVVGSLVRNGSAGATLVGNDADLARELEGADLVCYASMRPSPRQAVRVAELCESRGIAFLPTWRLGNELLLGLLWDPGTPSRPCWRCMWMRMVENGVAGSGEWWAALEIGDAALRPVPAVPHQAAAMLGGVLGFEIFKHVSGVTVSDFAQAVTIFDLYTFGTFRERPAIHPCCDRHGSWRAEGTEAARDPLHAMAPLQHQWVAPRLGIVTRFSDSGLRQIPIATAAVEIASLPRSLTSDGLVFGFGASSMAEARVDALERALARYEVYMLRRVQPQGHDGARGSVHALEPDQLTSWIGLDGARNGHHADPLVRGSVVDDSTNWLVPVAAIAASPASTILAQFEPSFDGLAVGASFDDALTKALVDAAGQVGIIAAARGAASLVPVPAAELEASERLRFYQRAASDLGSPVEIYALRTDSPIDLALVVSGGALGGRATVRAGLSWEAAAERALLYACGWAQLVHTGVRTGLEGESPLVDSLRWQDLEVLSPRGRGQSEPKDRNGLLSGLAALGLEPIAIDITSRDVAAQAPVSVVRVVLRRTRAGD